MIRRLVENFFERRVLAKPIVILTEKALKEAEEVSAVVKELTKKLMETEKKNEQTCAMLRAVIDSMPGMVWGKRLDGSFFLTNKRVRDKLLGGVSIKEARQGSAESFAAKTARGDTLHLDCARTDELVVQAEKGLHFIEKGFIDGKYVIFRTSKAPFYNGAGKLIGTVGFGREITDDCTLISKSLIDAKNALGTCPRVCDPSLQLVALLESMIGSVESKYSDACACGDLRECNDR